MDENRDQLLDSQVNSYDLLAGLMICGLCGSSFLTQRTKMPRAKVVYVCTGDKQGEPCKGDAIDGEQLASVVWEDLCSMLRDPIRIRSEFSRRKAQATSYEIEAKRLESSISKLETRIDRFIDAYQANLITEVELETRITPLRALLDRKHRQLQAAERTKEELDRATFKLATFSQAICGKWACVDRPLRSDICELLIKSIEVYDADTIRVIYQANQDAVCRKPR